MATATKPKANGDVVKFEDSSVEYLPLAETEPIRITVGMVKNMLAVRSRSGQEPAARDIMTYMMLCKSRKLNPFVGDAYLLGYDTQDGTKWSLITAVQALRKRAEANPDYDGCQRGVIVERNGDLVEREGSVLLDGEKLIGGWSVCKRKGHSLPYRETVNLSVYSTGKSRWGKDPAGMIVKCAEAASLRRAFPSDLAGLYVREEFESDERPQTHVDQATGMEGLRSRLSSITGGTSHHDAPSEVVEATDEPGEMEKALAPKQSAKKTDDVYESFRKSIQEQKSNAARADVVAEAGADDRLSTQQKFELAAYAEELATSKAAK